MTIQQKTEYRDLLRSLSIITIVGTNYSNPIQYTLRVSFLAYLRSK